jgi:hypothetical protein
LKKKLRLFGCESSGEFDGLAGRDWYFIIDIHVLLLWSPVKVSETSVHLEEPLSVADYEWLPPICFDYEEWDTSFGVVAGLVVMFIDGEFSVFLAFDSKRPFISTQSAESDVRPSNTAACDSHVQRVKSCQHSKPVGDLFCK